MVGKRTKEEKTHVTFTVFSLFLLLHLLFLIISKSLVCAGERAIPLWTAKDVEIVSLSETILRRK